MKSSMESARKNFSDGSIVVESDFFKNFNNFQQIIEVIDFWDIKPIPKSVVKYMHENITQCTKQLCGNFEIKKVSEKRIQCNRRIPGFLCDNRLRMIDISYYELSFDIYLDNNLLKNWIFRSHINSDRKTYSPEIPNLKNIADAILYDYDHVENNELQYIDGILILGNTFIPINEDNKNIIFKNLTT